MKKIIIILLILTLTLTLAACNTEVETDDSSANDTTPPVSNNEINNNDYSLATFAQYSGISSLPEFPDSEVYYDGAGSLTVIFTAKSDITDETFLPYAREVFDICKVSSPDGIYNINYDNYKKGDDVPAFNEEFWSGLLMAYWYYTNDGYIAQMYLSVSGDTLTVKINSVYNADTNARATP